MIMCTHQRTRTTFCERLILSFSTDDDDDDDDEGEEEDLRILACRHCVRKQVLVFLGTRARGGNNAKTGSAGRPHRRPRPMAARRSSSHPGVPPARNHAALYGFSAVDFV